MISLLYFDLFNFIILSYSGLVKKSNNCSPECGVLRGQVSLLMSKSTVYFERSKSLEKTDYLADSSNLLSVLFHKNRCLRDREVLVFFKHNNSLDF